MQSRGANNGLNMTESYQENIQHTWSISLTRVSALGRNRFVPHYLELILKLHLMYQCISRPNIAWAPFCHATTGLLLSILRSLCPGCHSLNLDFLLFPFCPSCKQLGDPRRLSFLSYLKTRRGPCRLLEQTLLLLYLAKIRNKGEWLSTLRIRVLHQGLLFFSITDSWFGQPSVYCM